MANERPTFSALWHRVRALKPRLRPHVQITRQHYRGRRWHVAHDPASNQFYRLSPVGYEFIGLLDGQRTVEEVWDISLGNHGDSAPTQPEVIEPRARCLGCAGQVRQGEPFHSRHRLLHQLRQPDQRRLAVGIHFGCVLAPLEECGQNRRGIAGERRPLADPDTRLLQLLLEVGDGDADDPAPLDQQRRSEIGIVHLAPEVEQRRAHFGLRLRLLRPLDPQAQSDGGIDDGLLHRDPAVVAVIRR